MYRGVSHFDRRKQDVSSFIIKAEFECAFLTAVRTELWRRIPSLEAQRRAELAKLRSAGDTQDETYALVPSRWAHATLFSAKPGTPPDVLLEIEERARTLLREIPSVGEFYELALITAETSTPLVLLGAT